MLHGGHQLAPEHSLRRIQVTSRLGGQGAVEPDVEDTRQLVGEVLLKQAPGGLGGALDAVTGVFVHVWGSGFGVRGSGFGVPVPVPG